MGLAVEELFELILRQPLPAAQGQSLHVHEQQVQDLMESQGLHTALRYVLRDSSGALNQHRSPVNLPAHLGRTFVTTTALDENQLQIAKTQFVASQTEVPREVGVHLSSDVDIFVDDIERIRRTFISTEVTVPTTATHCHSPAIPAP